MIERHIIFITDSAHPHKAAWLKPWADTWAQAGYHIKTLTLAETDRPNLETSNIHAVIEWLPTSTGLKEELIRHLEVMLPDSTLYFSAAYDVTTGTVASWCRYPQRLIGFSPLGLYKNNATVTLARHLNSTDTVQQKAVSLFKEAELDPQWIQDTPGLVMPRIYAMLVNEAAFSLLEGVADAPSIDTAMRLGTNYPMGPLTWADTVGLDEVLAILNHLWETYREDRYRPCVLLQQLVQAGHLGKIAGKGFYTYDTPQTVSAEKSTAEVF